MIDVEICFHSEEFGMKIQKALYGTILVFALILACICCAQAEGTQIVGKAWVEKDIDGFMQETEAALSAVKLTLEERLEDGTIVTLAETQTGRDGLYAFSLTKGGTYRLQLQLPSAYQFTYHGKDSAALPAQDQKSYTPFFTVEEDEAKVANIGATKTVCYISLFAFEDENANGGRMLTEPKVRDVVAELFYEYEGESYVIASEKTDRNGEAAFPQLSPGDYKLRVTLPGQFMVGPLGQKVNGFYNCVLASDSQVAYTDVFSLAPKGSQALGIGMVRTGSLEGKIWYDANVDGLWNDEETGLTGAELTLYSEALNLSRTGSVGEDGAYSFRHLQPGIYQLTFSLPDGMIFTRPGHSLISQIAAESTITLTVREDETLTVGEVGAMDASALSLLIYLDEQPVNGKCDAAEALLAGAEIALIQDKQTVAAATSTADGQMNFETLRSGEVTIRVKLPEGFLFAPGEDQLSDVRLPLREMETTVRIEADDLQAPLMVGVLPAASVSGLLFEDPYNMGLYNKEYEKLDGFCVQAVAADGTVHVQSMTDAAGQYTLYPLLPGEYTVRFLLSDPYVAAPFNDEAEDNNAIASQTPEYGETPVFSLQAGEARAHVNAAVFRAGSVDGYVLLNPAHDALSTQAGGMAGVTATLLDAFGAPVSEFSYGVTDENGYYYIKGVLPGTYSLRYTLPENAAFTTPMTESRETESPVFQAESGSELHMEPIGAVTTSSLSGTVLHKGEVPVAAHLTLTAHTFGLTYEAETDAQGKYMLCGMRPDTYTLTVALTDPNGFVFGDGDATPVAAAPVSKTEATISFTMGQSVTDANIYPALPASLQGNIFYDANANGDMDMEDYGAQERYISIFRKDVKIADLVTDEDGGFVLTELVPGAYSLRTTLEENELLVGINPPSGNEWSLSFEVEDGAVMQQLTVPMLRYASLTGSIWSLDGTRSGVQGISVSLLDDDNQAVATAVSDAEGSFRFEGLYAGTYILNAALPAGYLFAREQDLTERDSMIFSQTDGTVVSLLIEVPMGDDLSGMDIGIGAMGTIGDYAWLDANGNGMQDIDELPIPGIQIALYQHGQLIAQTQTNEYGFYRLDGLYPGAYEMLVTMHKELKATVHQEKFPLVASILPQEKGVTLSVENIIVPSGGSTLHYDLGFQPVKKNVYPDAMKLIPVKDWRPYSEREGE